MNRDLREAIEILSLVGAHEIGPALAVRARAVVERLEAGPKRRRQVRLDRSKERREGESAEDLEAAARTAKVRAAVWKRCGGWCEICVAHGPRTAATELHHVLNGADRGPQEAPETCLGLCLDHHDAMHAKGALKDLHLEVLEAAHELCTKLRFHQAAAALARRIEKVIEARRFAARSAP